jgi:hypothetical protein
MRRGASCWSTEQEQWRSALWKRVFQAIKEIQRQEPREDEAVN